MSVTSSSEQSEIENDDSSIDYIGTHEVLECQEGELEAGLDVHTQKCNKPHDGFIPIQDLSTQHFPPGYHNDDLLEFTKTLAELTVKIDVKFISNDRPKLTPITREPYPFYHARADLNTMTSEEDLSIHFKGAHEVLECLEGQGEVDLHTHWANCRKNPDHKHFIPVNNLSLEYFPPDYRENDIYDFTKAISDLTVRIAITFASPDRPEFVQDTDEPYPCYQIRDKHVLRTGTGKVCRVTKHTEGMDGHNTCPCPECKHPNTPSKIWWEVVVLTASHVVYDDSEARQSSCRLWFDEENCPIVNIHGWKVVGFHTVGDVCELSCTTHDEELCCKLQEMLLRENGLFQKLSDKYKCRKDVDKLTIIVSHPHGCSKQVSIGFWVHRQVYQQLMGKATSYTYTASTCPGSSGAMVYRLGYSWPAHPHSGANSGGLNYSGSGGWDFNRL
ncbi:uncharacterized protein LOC131943867 [Physella acuta]|uniref:uncharacterized protein LOC131943867 n=1 Tax=Physella acuta TaxID=109671 RepID=UPI0027DBA5BC|nr:uncharacterized protein LOC131943867 [Physella acuta]